MRKTEAAYQRLKQNRLLALLTPKSIEECLAAYEIFEQEGFLLEVAMRSEYALGGIELILERHPEALVFAGTVMTRQQAEDVIKAGVAGVISADFIPEVVDVCVDNDIMCIPGGLSDAGKQLVHKANKYGCTLEELKAKYPYQWIYKLFPVVAGRVFHTDLSHVLRAPYKDLTVVYAGGVTLENLRQIVKSDPEGIICGSALTKKLDNPEKLAKEIKEWKEIIHPPAGQPSTSHREIEKAVGASPGVVTFGELMLRLSSAPGVRLRNANSFDLHFGGAEANVAVSLAQFGMNSSFVTALPDNDIGENAIGTLKSLGVNTSAIIRIRNRMGIYFLEHGAGPRASKVIYDRAHSAFTEVTSDDFAWDQILDNADWFHWTGITPALGAEVLETLRTALEAAKRKGITVSADLNYRRKLWPAKEAEGILSELMSFVDVLFANEEDPATVFGISPAETDIERGKINIGSYKSVAEDLIKRFGLEKVAITLRGSVSASQNRWSACLHNGENFLISPKYDVQVVDRVGAGDAFAAGLIYGILSGKDDQEALDFAVAASCLKHSIYGDFNLVDADEVENLASGKTGGRVQR